MPAGSRGEGDAPLPTLEFGIASLHDPVGLLIGSMFFGLGTGCEGAGVASIGCRFPERIPMPSLNQSSPEAPVVMPFVVLRPGHSCRPMSLHVILVYRHR